MLDSLFGLSRHIFEGPWTWDRKGYDQAKANFRAIHGHDPHPWFNAFTVYYEYREPKGAYAILLMDAEQLAAKAADLSQRIDAAKRKHGMA